MRGNEDVRLLHVGRGDAGAEAAVAAEEGDEVFCLRKGCGWKPGGTVAVIVLLLAVPAVLLWKAAGKAPWLGLHIIGPHSPLERWATHVVGIVGEETDRFLGRQDPEVHREQERMAWLSSRKGWQRGDFRWLSEGSCIGVGWVPILDHDLCKQSAKELDMTLSHNQLHPTGDVPRPDGCYYLADTKTFSTTLWLSTNRLNSGKGAETSGESSHFMRWPICVARARAVKELQSKKGGTDWRLCATQNPNQGFNCPECILSSVCTCSGEVRYGYNERWTAWRPVQKSIECADDVFGDPYPGQGKMCLCRQSSMALQSRSDVPFWAMRKPVANRTTVKAQPWPTTPSLVMTTKAVRTTTVKMTSPVASTPKAKPTITPKWVPKPKPKPVCGDCSWAGVGLDCSEAGSDHSRPCWHECCKKARLPVVLAHVPGRAGSPNLQFKRCALVGASDILLGKGLGSQIDGHDVVIRVNRIPTQPYTGDFGMKTDVLYLNDEIEKQWGQVYMYGGQKRKCSELPNCRNAGLVFLHSGGGGCPFAALRNSWGWDHTFLACPALRLKRMTWRIGDLHGKPASTGFVAFMNFAPVCEAMDVYGFYGMTTADGHREWNQHPLAAEHTIEHQVANKNWGSVHVDMRDFKADEWIWPWYQNHVGHISFVGP